MNYWQQPYEFDTTYWYYLFYNVPICKAEFEYFKRDEKAVNEGGCLGQFWQFIATDNKFCIKYYEEEILWLKRR